MERLTELGDKAGALFGENLGGGALVGEAAFVEFEDLGVELEGFGDVMSDGEDGRIAAGEPDAQVGDEFVAEGGVKGGEGFV